MALHLQGQGPKKKAATVSHHMQGVFRGGGGGRGGSKGGTVRGEAELAPHFGEKTGHNGL